MTAFPTIASTFSETTLGLFTVDQYGLDKNSKCKLLRTGINHTYLVSGNETKHVLRVYSYNWRSRKEIFEEINLLLLLRKNQVSVSYPIPNKHGEFINEIHAPEGIRYAVLFSYANGSKVRFMDLDICAAVGSMMAQIHNLTAQKEIARIHYNGDSLLNLPYEYAMTHFPKTLPEMSYVKEMCDTIGKSFDHGAINDIRAGIIHIDIWYDNMHISDKKEITLFDFDFCGTGFLILDVAYFCKQLFHIETDKHAYKQKAQSFLKGYQSVRSLSKKELELISYAGAAIWIFYLGVQSQRFDWSNIFLTENYLKMYVGKMKSWMEYHSENGNAYIRLSQ